MNPSMEYVCKHVLVVFRICSISSSWKTIWDCGPKRSTALWQVPGGWSSTTPWCCLEWTSFFRFGGSCSSHVSTFQCWSVRGGWMTLVPYNCFPSSTEQGLLLDCFSPCSQIPFWTSGWACPWRGASYGCGCPCVKLPKCHQHQWLSWCRCMPYGQGCREAGTSPWLEGAEHVCASF